MLAFDLPADRAPLHIGVARTLAEDFREGRAVDRARLSELFAGAAAESDATGAWSLRQAYDALELAQTLFVTACDCPLVASDPFETLGRIAGFAAGLPAQTFRSERQVELQQFSTPLAVAWLAARAAGLGAGDCVLEPSAGNGLLACWAARTGCSLLLNELDSTRAASLAAAFPDARLFAGDAELIDDLLPREVAPTAVVMNPPFARSVGRGEDRHAAGRHLLAALSRLAPGGRLVAIMPEGFTLSGSGRQLRLQADRSARPSLDALIAPGAFARHGTGVAVRLMVLDKHEPDSSAPLALAVDSLEDLLTAIDKLPPRAVAPPAAGRRAPARLFKRSVLKPARPVPASHERSGGEGTAVPLSYRVLREPASLQDQVGLYLPYRPSRIVIDGAQTHPTPLVESLAMGSIAAPEPDYVPLLPARVVAGGVLSEPQLETLVYAGSAFARDLPGRFVTTDQGCDLAPADEGGDCYRGGYFLGDGTGAGKGRQLAGVMLDQWLRGNRRHVWISKNEALLEDARRDWIALGGLSLDIQPLSRWKLGTPVEMDAGILFVTYPTLRSGRAEETRLAQVAAWAGSEFEGVIAFDEAHAMANAAGGESSRGKVKGSEQGLAGIRLQNLLPRARVLYASATGASDINNLAYAARLGLWGPATAFADRTRFVDAIRQGGIAAMELVARDLKALGLYAARALSFAGVEYDVLEHRLTPAQIEIYDAYADAWAIIHGNLATALEATRVVDAATGDTLNPHARSAALSRFEGTKQRFFAQLLLSMKLPSLIRAIDDDLASGHAVVIQLVSTAEAMLDRRLADLAADEREAIELDLSPREYVIDYLSAAFPTRQMRVFTDAEGNVRSEPMSDDQGRPVHCQAALRAREALIEQLCALPPIGTALDALLERFGVEAMAEVTGRSRRLVPGPDGRQVLQQRTARANLSEADAFMRGDKRILVFSDAGGTGRSYHACLGAANQARRIHYLLEPGWRADMAIQGLGRTHRTRQASAPLFRPVTTDVRGERRFISTIARRLDALGALTRGQRQTGGQNLFDPADNLESDYAREALLRWYRLLHAGKIRSVTLGEFQAMSGLKLESDDGALREDLPPIQRWLNRLLALRISVQNAIFEEFLGLIEARVAAAKEAGTLDVGVETVMADSFAILEDSVLRTDPRSGAITHLLRVELARRLSPLRLERVAAIRATRAEAVPMLNARSGKAALRVPARSLTSEDGLPVPRFELIRPTRRDYLRCDAIEETSWAPTTERRFAEAWQAEAEEAAATPRRETLHLATGLLLPVWDKLSDDHVQVIRIAASNGRSLLGRLVGLTDLAELGAKLGRDIPLALSCGELAKSVMSSGKPLPCKGPEPLTLKRALVNGSQRLELAGFSAPRLAWYKAQGCFTEIIRYQTRLFVPVDRPVPILEAVAAAAS